LAFGVGQVIICHEHYFAFCVVDGIIAVAAYPFFVEPYDSYVVAVGNGCGDRGVAVLLPYSTSGISGSRIFSTRLIPSGRNVAINTDNFGAGCFICMIV
jgi:hypothetical protein